MTENNRALNPNMDGPGRYLLRENRSFAEPFEADIIEWSEGGRVKIAYIGGNTSWSEGWNMPLFVEALPAQTKSEGSQ